MADEVATLMVGNSSEAIDKRDIIVAQQVSPFQHNSKLHVGYMVLHYLLLFLYGEDEWHSNILLNGVVLQDVDADLDEDHAKESKHHKNYHNVTMAEFDGYQLQHRDIGGIALLWGDQLRQQYIVDAYAAIEHNCLRYMRLNQKKFCVDFYQGL